mmetsp:Transcript_43934/g.93510  ORF Transcript_43934/g.93510 Transcript_43934/m.93510 type:complete len:613 (+) Transcript_43934:293-2131(+)|eukprot:CAMPEP_0172538398 /NCGR_PEP_ID=MMETSP1067-20121228/9782_1 /TAXON_ID=265564 ORGANISM="Thalassiosira punctigera, Strain Tpunct2005C2" /NCGR_SAMPLE_ID=MMETSP1067 /ASSEMBLY_ACC=CAM_ASM_000444 /LENGTH=612 /DNA_ID=CAMNT_0013323883 /DNA_START=250 /DNA_END=2088 /DNA_ORIENTATION=+
MAKDNKPSSNSKPKARPHKKHAGDITRGKSHAELLSHRKSLREEIRALPADQRSKVMTHFHGGERSDLARARLQNLKQDDKNGDTSNLSEYQVRSLRKRKSRPNGNMALRRQAHRRDAKRLANAAAAADAEDILRTHAPGLVEVENDMEKTVQLTQRELKHGDHLGENVARNVYDLDLNEYSPYKMRYDRSGRHALLAGRGGHVSIIDQHTMALKTEFFVRETVRDACFLHNGSMMAVSQEKNVFIYDQDGVEIHRLDGHRRVGGMEFLPYHWLLATIGNTGVLQYQDTSTGSLVSQHRTKLGPCHAIRQNPFNSILHLGHTNGTVTLWSPSSSEYLVKMLCHKGSPITSLAIDQSGRYMATGGGDSKVKIFDLRTYKEIHCYNTYGGAPTCLDISQTGVLGVGHGCHTTFWRPEALRVKMKEPYMKHQLSGKGPLESLRFRPFEDVCGIGHASGISSIVIPGSGEPELDSTEHFTNPYADTKQQREAEVRSLLEKLSPDMIALDPDSVGGIEESNLIQRQQRLRDLAEEADAKRAADSEAEKGKKEKKRMRGRSKIAKKLRRKQKNIVDENVVKLKELREKEKEEKARLKESTEGDGDSGDEAPAALKRFF